MAEHYVNLLLRGTSSSRFDDVSPESDDYVDEFKKNNLIAITIPILKFKFKNLDLLAEVLSIAEDEIDNSCYGLVMTSPRVVEAIREVTQQSFENSKKFLSHINPDHLFVVGVRTGMLCERMLNIKYNKLSSSSGRSLALGNFIRNFFRESKTEKTINLIYPTSSRSGDDIETALATESKIKIKKIDVYDTEPIDNLPEIILNRLISQQSCVKANKLILNLVFFSPSGVESFFKIDQKCLEDNIIDAIGSSEVTFRYTSIGTTTASSLRSRNIEVSCISEKPSPVELVKAIMKVAF